ncbi:hypothetical protein [Cellulomonas gilvus]|uniref:hypothetical protein n=1 Tax=Cellulomonas gilvus TaxID=11 RepID=UPI00123741BE|nr:hypothetical protein [Cellulomonas gilvus]
MPESQPDADADPDLHPAAERLAQLFGFPDVAAHGAAVADAAADARAFRHAVRLAELVALTVGAPFGAAVADVGADRHRRAGARVTFSVVDECPRPG